MLVAANIYTLQMKRLLERWKLEGVKKAGSDDDAPTPGHQLAAGAAAAQPQIPLSWTKPGYRFLSDDELGPAVLGDTSFGGMMVVYDWPSGDIVWRQTWGNMLVTPSGFCFADGAMFVNDLEGANILKVDVDTAPGRLLARISHHYFNDLHSLERTKRGFLVTCSGTDLILEIDARGQLLYEWWAAEHGYTTTPSGESRSSGRGDEHRNRYYHTRYHTTHLNDATFRDDDERYLLALLFHQGQLIEIDRSLPPEKQSARILLDGLRFPHGLERIPGGWLFANTAAKELVLLDDAMQVRKRIAYDGGWIQDCTRLSNGHIVLNDVDNHRLVEFAPPRWKIARVVPYDVNWRMGELLEVPEPYATSLICALAEDPADDHFNHDRSSQSRESRA